VRLGKGFSHAAVLLGSGTFCILLISCGGSQQSTPITPPGPPAITPSTAYYVDCSGTANGSGTRSSPWNSVAYVNTLTFQPGDTIYFNRGTTCTGGFTPPGSGTSAAPITISAYGTGAVPVIDGQTARAVLSLTDQSYWSVQNLKLLHGEQFGLLVSATGTSINGINITNVEATGANFISIASGDSGEIVMQTPGNNSATINNSGVYNSYAHDSQVSRGIFIAAGSYASMTSPKGSSINIENSTVSNVYGDGILVEDGFNVSISGNTVSKSGQCPACTGPTPVGIWCWNSTNVVMQGNESYLNNSWGGDGGGMDIDFWNSNVTVQYNYVHDNKGYCVSVFGSSNEATVNSVIRYNICANNVVLSNSTYTGDFELYTWNGGSLNGVQIYNNTSSWDSDHTGASALLVDATFSGATPSFFKNNLIDSMVPAVIYAASPMVLDNNLYWNASGAGYDFNWNGSAYSTFADYQAASNQDAHSVNADPLLSGAGYHAAGAPTLSTGDYTTQIGSPAVGAGIDVCAGVGGCIGGQIGTQDFFGQALTSTHNIGAFD
jgi:hypothetical protein